MNKSNCFGCKKKILAKYAKTEDGLYYHQTCFKCYACGDSLVNKLYYIGPDASGYYCKKDFLYRWGIPCKVCPYYIEKKVLRDDLGNTYHESCLNCTTCKITLKENCYKYRGHFYCKCHYQSKCGIKCDSCGDYIEETPRRLMGAGAKTRFHENCFNCLWCENPLPENFTNCERVCPNCQLVKHESESALTQQSAPEDADVAQAVASISNLETSNTKSKLKVNDPGVIGECTICCEKKVDSVIIPCGHMCLCYDCAAAYFEDKIETQRVCPICRAPSTAIYRTYSS